MHTTETEHAIFIHNGDYEGPIKIRLKNFTDEIEIEFEDLKEFVSGWVRQEKERALEGMTANQLLLKFTEALNSL